MWRKADLWRGALCGGVGGGLLGVAIASRGEGDAWGVNTRPLQPQWLRFTKAESEAAAVAPTPPPSKPPVETSTPRSRSVDFPRPEFGEPRRLWDSDWDRREHLYHSAKAQLKEEAEEGGGALVVRNLLLIRHGQYVHGSSPEERVLTALGRKQAELTGLRLAGLGVEFDALHVSTMVRARETAGIIRSHLSPEVPVLETDLLREGRPCNVVPARDSFRRHPEYVHVDSPRIEAAFRKLFQRKLQVVSEESGMEDGEKAKRQGKRLVDRSEKERFEVVVCHANVIRYFVMRALQLNPEAWLRLSLANCGITWVRIYANGNVSLRLLGDVGHIPPEEATIS